MADTFEYRPTTDKNTFNSKLDNIKNSVSTNEIEKTGKTAQSKRISVEGSKSTDVGQLIGGFLSLTKNTKQNVAITDEPIVSVVTESVPGVTTTKVSSSKGDIATLTGTTTEDGQLDTLVVTMNPAGIKAALQDVFTVTDTQIKTALQETSPVPDKVEEASNEDIAQTITADAEKIVKKANRTLGNPLGSNAKFGSLGNSFGNILGAVLGKIKGSNISDKFGEILPGKPLNFQVPEGIDEPVDIINVDGSTNITESTEPPRNTAETVKPTREPYVFASNVSEWNGAATKLITTGGTYEFSIVHTSEELEAELRNTTREITVGVTHWTRTHSDSPLDAYHIHRLHQANQWKTLGGDADALKKLVAGGPKYGIEWHYVIQKDGTIQRGRPIDVETGDGVGFKKNSIHIGFVAGYTAAFGTPNSELTLGPQSITSEQWKSFDKFLDAFYRSYPGGEVLSHREIDKNSTCPGFDVTTYVSGKYNKTSVYEDPSKLEEPYTPEEQINIKPKSVKKSTASTIDTPIDTEKLKDADENVVITDATLDQYASGYHKVELQVNTLSREIRNDRKRLEEIEHDPIHDAESFRIRERIKERDAQLKVKRNDLEKRRKDLMNNGYTYNGSLWSK